MLSLKKITGLLLLLIIMVIVPSCSKTNTGNNPPPPPPPPPPPANTFTNPLLNGADPWVAKKDDFYYYLHTLGNRVAIWKTKTMSKLNNAPITTIFSVVPGTPNSSNLWAPELHFLDGKWYVYYTAGSGPDDTQRMWVLENSNADPLAGTWVDKGRMFTSDADFWSIDGSVLEYNGSKYFLWSGRPNIAVQNQNIYIAKMTNAFTLETPTVMITKPDLPWELNGPVNEGPQIIKNSSGKVFMVYSASGCWTDDYALGMLTLKDGGNPLLPADWTKNVLPVFEKQPSNNAFGPGHNAFFKSPNGTEDWIIYHANTNAGGGCGAARNIRIQKVNWNTDGTPNFGIPVKTGTAVTIPSGE